MKVIRIKDAKPEAAFLWVPAGAQATGAADYWYAKSSSPIKTLQDTNGEYESTLGTMHDVLPPAMVDFLAEVFGG